MHVCRELECSKSGERWVILGCLLYWEQSDEIKLDSRPVSIFGHESTLGKFQGKSDLIQKVLELVPNARTRPELALKELRP